MDSAKQQKILIAWLKDAHAMEKSLEQTMKAFAKAAEAFPDLQTKLEEHIETTKDQAERIETRLTAMGEDTSTMKNVTGEIMGALQGYGATFAKDEVIKNALKAFASEYYEIASYNAIAAAATELGDTETVDLADSIIEEEQEMADWAEENLPDLVEQFLEGE